jgi:hypothetical protein
MVERPDEISIPAGCLGTSCLSGNAEEVLLDFPLWSLPLHVWHGVSLSSSLQAAVDQFPLVSRTLLKLDKPNPLAHFPPGQLSQVDQGACLTYHGRYRHARNVHGSSIDRPCCVTIWWLCSWPAGWLNTGIPQAKLQMVMVAVRIVADEQSLTKLLLTQDVVREAGCHQRSKFIPLRFRVAGSDQEALLRKSTERAITLWPTHPFEHDGCGNEISMDIQVLLTPVMKKIEG